MKRARSALLVVLALLTTQIVVGRDLATVWLATTPEMGAFLSDDDPDLADQGWLAVSHSVLAGVDALSQTALEGGLVAGVRIEGAWQHTGAPGSPWREDRIRGRLGRRGWPVALIGLRRSVRAAGTVWPGSWEVALQPIVAPGPGVRIIARIPLAEVTRPWTTWGGEPRLALALRSQWTLGTLALVDGAAGEPALRCQGWLRFGTGIGLGAGWDGSTGETALLIAVRRGGLLLRSRHAVHPLLGLEHGWQVGWVGDLGR